MDTNTLITFSRHIKLAYGAKEHKILVDLSSGSDASPGVRNLMRAGSLGTDKGLRHPHSSSAEIRNSRYDISQEREPFSFAH